MRVYKFDEEEYTTREAAEEAAREKAEETYDDMLDEIYPMIRFGYLEWYPSIVLKRVDEVAYRCGLCDYESSLIEEIEEIEI